MSFDAKSELLKALKGNANLVSLCVGGFHNLKANDVTKFPRIVYAEIRNADEDFADNEAISAEVRFQISIFNTEENISSQTAIAKEVDKTMKSIGYTRYDSVDLYEEDTKVFHKAMRYQKIFR
ncbi:tail completion protein gp17 [Parageobacillus thermoglucosidasius]|uniref:tail completion protein gp17 n=1 Tax=Parageobacillus thermoglucosidasius TaxID=1426 RepID=UPI000B5716F3|nr:DUF3168 domain-containing protein [Parageobacillus thermoglucosidasius]MBY6269320.1 hypothetical protein [Parageobacillus thermoglucosidasius]OUM84945.1 MAG: hypothetical protein BAA00_02495 [Parageobacillus thermoglucosidasius]